MSEAEIMGRLFYIATSVLNLTPLEYSLSTEGQFLTLYQIHRYMTGLDKEPKETTIDDIIPPI